MDYPRLVVIFVAQVWLQLVSLSPNVDNESGFEEVADNNPGEFKRYVIYNSIIALLSLDHLTYNFNIPLSVYEWFLIFVTGLLFGLRMWSYYTLGKFFTFKLGIMNDHHLITTGPYRYLIHPSYSGQIGLLFVMLIFFKAYYFMLVFVPYSLIKLHKRMEIEEQMFIKKFGDHYRDYITTRYRLIPFIY